MSLCSATLAPTSHIMRYLLSVLFTALLLVSVCSTLASGHGLLHVFGSTHKVDDNFRRPSAAKKSGDPANVKVEYCGSVAKSNFSEPNCMSNCTSFTVASGQCIPPSKLPFYNGASTTLTCGATTHCFLAQIWEGQGCQGRLVQKAKVRCGCHGGKLDKCGTRGLDVMNCSGSRDCSANCKREQLLPWGACTNITKVNGMNSSARVMKPVPCHEVEVNRFDNDPTCQMPPPSGGWQYNYSSTSGECDDMTYARAGQEYYSLKYTCEA